ncbi:Transport and Golgi organization protein 6 -like protein, partial [Caligus rogercresseyi]
MSDSFQALEDHHEDERIRALARKLRTFIYTHGVVVDSTKDLKGKVDKIKESTKRLKDMANTLKELEEEEK